MTASRMSGTLIASVPAVLGYFPQQSLVVMTFRRGGLGATTAIDIPVDIDQAIANVGDWAVSVRAEAAVAVLVDAQGGAAAVIHSALVRALALRGVGLLGTHVVPEIAAGARWVCGDGCGVSGVVDDPVTTPVAVLGVVAGRRVYRSRAELHAAVEVVDSRRTAAIADIIEADASSTGVDDCDDKVAARAMSFTVAVAKRVSRGGRLREMDYVRLGRVLGNGRVRDMLLGLAITSKAPRTEVLWTVLARELPGPWRVEALVLLGFFAYVRGDQPLAEVAVLAALQSDPEHSMAGTLDAALRTGRRPSRIWELAEFGYSIAHTAGIRMPRPLGR